MKKLTILFALLCVVALAGKAGAANAVALGPGRTTVVNNPSADAICPGAIFNANDDGSYEDGYGWEYAGVVAPYYGAWAEGFSMDAGMNAVCGVRLGLTQVGNQDGWLMDVYVWDDPYGFGTPNSVLSVTVGVNPGVIGSWPTVTQHDIDIPDTWVPTGLASRCFVGWWPHWVGASSGWYIASDNNGFAGGLPRTNIAPGIGFPTGWHHPNVVSTFAGCMDLGIGVYEVEYSPPPAFGACCDPLTGGCTLTTADACLAPNVWHADWPSCTPNPCPEPDGACCNPTNGECTVVSQAACIYDWVGYGTGCTPNPCPQPPTGACCALDGACTVTTQANCASPRVWHADWTTCVPNLCPPPQGACCNPATGECTFVTQLACAYDWMGFGTSCTPNLCPQPPATGSCCAPDGSCTVTTQADCASPRVWHADWTTCVPNLCPPPQGACCNPATGDCTFVTQTSCAYDWMGFGTVCSPNPCPPPPTGSCCAPDASCTVTTQTNCTGTWTAAGVCVPNPCPPPGGTGACCAHDGTCTVMTQAECPYQWFAGGVCEPNPCPQPPVGACCIAQTCTLSSDASCSGQWYGAGSDCEPNPCLEAPTGSCCHVGGDCTVTTQASCSAPSTWTQGGVCAPNPCPQTSPITVTNVVAVQRPGTELVDVTYDVQNAVGPAVTVDLYISPDDGNSFPIHCLAVSGDVGAGILNGTGRHIVWDAGADYPGHVGDAYAAKVTADDPGHPGMIWIQGGTVRLGQSGIEEPVNDFYVDGFYIDRQEVSNAMYKAFIDAGGYTTEAYWNPIGWAWIVANGITLPQNWNSGASHGGGVPGNEQFPAHGVSWWEADAYCRWAGGRLPTEAEWEKAAKGGCEIHGDPGSCDASDTPSYPWGEGIMGPQANYYASGDPYDPNSTPVGYYDGSDHDGYQTIDSPSPYGLYDVAGNVREWCSTKYAAYPYDPNDGRENPPTAYNGSRVLRGGHWSGGGNTLRCAIRDISAAHGRANSTGFRCARTR